MVTRMMAMVAVGLAVTVPTAPNTTAAPTTPPSVLDVTPLVAPLQVVQPVNVPLAAVDSRAAAREAGEAALVARPDGAAAIAASNPVYVDTTPPPPPSSGPSGPSGPSDAVLAALRGCESGGDYAAVSGGGAYRGAYQFAPSTWDSVASRWFAHLVGLDPAAAAPADQDAMARALFTERGWAPWPTCALGL